MVYRWQGPAIRVVAAVLWTGLWLTAPAAAHAQVGTLVAPGPLSKAHAQLEGVANCQKCHEPGRALASTKCLGCHKPIAERVAARKGVHRDTAGKCEGCHAEHRGTAVDLRPIDARQFDHAAETGFPLDGRHAPLASACARCHKTRSFLTASRSCASCHDDVHKGALGASCSACHTTAVPFADARKQFDHAKARFALTGAHVRVDCAKCHVNKLYRGVKFAVCTDCHREPHRPTLGSDCTSCHTTESWKTRKFDHARTAFPLKGAHATLPCTACHVKPPTQVRLQAKACRDCHSDVHAGQFKQDCGSCHTPDTFKTVAFDHATAAKFPLTGRHLRLPCARCHKSATTTGPVRTTGGRATAGVTFSGLSPACASCHEDVHRGAAGPGCETCHTTSDFRSVKPYAHPAALDPFFAGRHGALSCRECHARSDRSAVPKAAGVAWSFKGVGTACATCHRDPHDRELGEACERCHTVGETAFAASRFSHGATAFPLTGRHTGLRCIQCHQARPGSPAEAPAAPRQTPGRDETGRVLQFKGRGTECASCHKDVHLGQLGQQCQSCHTTDGFALKRYAHKQLPAGFLTGKHATADCGACHKTETGRFPAGQGTAKRFAGLGTACATCHPQADAHRGALGVECGSCHTPTAWRSASRAFHKATLFPLEGRHLAAPCASCHLGGVLKGTPTKCFDCHWIRRRDDPYETRLGNQCETCHRPTSWTAVNWNHAARTGFPLNGGHRPLTCGACHQNNRFAGTPFNCVSCHRQNYDRTTQPNHAAAGFPLTCEACHSPGHTSWNQASLTHTSFPLVGLHATQACAACHKNGVYKGTPRDCVGCHLADYQKTTSPNHAASGFSTACEGCHRPTDSSFKGGGFNHASTFALVGLHATQPCAACHKNGVYKGTPRDCVGCHQADYQRTVNPNHTAAGFPTTCDACHRASDTAWTQGRFTHTAFPITSGRHTGIACATCHTTSTNYQLFSCLTGCHARSSTDSHHSGVNGYRYDSAACYACHPTGRAGRPRPAW